MKKVCIESPIYKEKSIQFDGITMKFNAEGKANLEIKDEQEKELKEILETYPNIYLEGQAPKVEAKKEVTETTEKKDDEKDAIIASLKQSNINLAKENAALKKEVAEYKAKIEALTNANPEKKEEKPEDLNDTKGGEENEALKQELSSKTVEELKTILNDVYADFKEEWSGLKKKDEIINYMVEKANQK